MANRRLTLRSESLNALESDELASVVGALSVPHPLCAVTSVQYSACPTCGIACTYNCSPTS
ncbi:MAG TPA: hypothetical protein VGX28_08930 [Frankiaceae bacterium]|jgi:hypothetical protein|nr:hypothetical protein [Frankiaceae bacterium]